MADFARKPTKVVIIETEYVETDSKSFKSVVQRLTGKEYSTTPMEVAPPPPRDLGFSRKDLIKKEEMIQKDVGVIGPGDYPVLMRDWSFKEFERLLKEIPTLEELQRISSD